jgi:hypothetical protein
LQRPADVLATVYVCTELANLCSTTIDEVADFAEDGLDRIGSDAALCTAFLHHAGLKL